METLRNLIVVSDLHCGCQFGLCPPKKIVLDGGGTYEPSKLQKKVWHWWQIFWDEWVPQVTRGEPFAICINGDTTDGRHHQATTQVSQNLSDQKHIAEECLLPLIEKCARLPTGASALFLTRGTEAHTGPAGENEEMLARSLGAVPDSVGNHARNELWITLGGKGGCLVHLLHHIGTTGRTHYESSAPMGELGESFAEAGRFQTEAPSVIVRSHRHRHIKITVPTARGYGIVEVTPGWQLKTPFVYHTLGGRITTPQFGGVLVRQGDEEYYTRAKVWGITRPGTVVL